MLAVSEQMGMGRAPADAMTLVDLHAKELRLKELKIEELVEMLERQAGELVTARRALSECQTLLTQRPV